MELSYGIATTQIELQQILHLQEQNLPNALQINEQNEEGFVTVVHSLSLLEQMNRQCPHIICKDGSKVVGYALCMHPCFSETIPVLTPMFAKISAVVPTSTSYIVMGQVCIDKAYRKQGIFRKLYAYMRKVTREKFDCIITEVDTTNQRSLQAHYAVGFLDLATYTSGNQHWKLIQLS